MDSGEGERIRRKGSKVGRPVTDRRMDLEDAKNYKPQKSDLPSYQVYSVCQIADAAGVHPEHILYLIDQAVIEPEFQIEDWATWTEDDTRTDRVLWFAFAFATFMRVKLVKKGLKEDESFHTAYKRGL